MVKPELPPPELLLLLDAVFKRLGAIVRRRGSLLAAEPEVRSTMRSDWEICRGLPLSKDPKIVAREEESLPGPSMQPASRRRRRTQRW